MAKAHADEPAIPISYGSTDTIETGKWSSLKPESLEMVAPCQEACPVGTDIPLFLHFIERGRYAEALATVLMENPLPGICGRVCFHPCEAGCNRTQFDEAVSIQILERFIASAPSAPSSIQPAANEDPKRIAIIGSGPAGLSCAYFLALLGHSPTILEARKEPGGVMRWGIPPFRLPKTVLKKELQRILALPIKLQTNCRAGKDISFEELDQYDAVFLSPGAELNALLSVEGEHLEGVWGGGEFLERINSKEKVRLGKTTLVIGGGNTAIDVARSALRLGSKVAVVYRRTRNEMPAIPDEIAEAEEEGVAFHFLMQPVKIQKGRKKRLKVTFQQMKIRGVDKSGRPKAIPVRGEFIALDADSVISAVGELVDLAWIPEKLVKNGLVDANATPKIFAGGDAVPQPRTIAAAIASAKRAAISMDLVFRGIQDGDILSKIRIGNKGSLSLNAYLQHRDEGIFPDAKEVVSHRRIHTLYFEESRRVKTRKLSGAKRRGSFLEVNLEPELKKALISASRCYSCGRCNACYNCFYYCPEGAIAINRDRRTRTVDLTHCKGCGTCARACPRSAVEMRDLP